MKAKVIKRFRDKNTKKDKNGLCKLYEENSVYEGNEDRLIGLKDLGYLGDVEKEKQEKPKEEQPKKENPKQKKAKAETKKEK